ncbi:hypothetical protein OH779_27015 [Actinacidiphila glaucinigra]|uniref:hypothetical protein n=1 Tax=Actinacidiphila glaucinigra TaxID=235986 RepID=UPI003868AF6B
MTDDQARPWGSDAPSPLAAIRQMRADAQGAVVALGSQTGSQAAAYVPSAVDNAITELASRAVPPHAIFVTGSAGGGKSGAAEFQRQAHADRFSVIVEDATHADSPGEDQADSLARRLAQLADNADQRPSAPVLVAANIGMLIQLAPLWKEREFQFTALVHALFTRLGLPVEDLARQPMLPLQVEVLNLDHRPTTGEGSLLPEMLKRLAPGDGTTLFDARRCGTCPAISHCPAHANAVLLSTVASNAFDKVARRAAVERGRSDTPRALWDLVSRAVLRPELYDGFADPCEASLQAHQKDDATFVLKGLLPVTAFTAGGEVGPRIAAQSPALAPTREAYEAFSDSGLLPLQDARPVERLAEAAENAGVDAPALRKAAEALRTGLTSLDAAQERAWRDLVAATVIGSRYFLGELPDPQFVEEERFLRALGAYERWQAAERDSNADTALEEDVERHVSAMVDELASGFAALFGAQASGGTYLPVHIYDAREPTRAFVQFKLTLAEAVPVPDKPSSTNPDGTRHVGYRPMAVSLRIERGLDSRPDAQLAVDLPSYRILSAATRGMASSGDAERVYALRRAAATLARLAEAGAYVPMLVDDPVSGCRFVIEPRTGFSGKLTLNARMVNE